MSIMVLNIILGVLVNIFVCSVLWSRGMAYPSLFIKHTIHKKKIGRKDREIFVKNQL